MQDTKSSKVGYQPLPSERASSSIAHGGTGNNLFSNIEIHEDKIESGIPIHNIDEVQSSISHGGTGG